MTDEPTEKEPAEASQGVPAESDEPAPTATRGSSAESDEPAVGAAKEVAAAPPETSKRFREGRVYWLTGTTSGRQRTGGSFWNALRDELYADNSFVVTFLAIVLALTLGGALMILGNEQVRQQWGYFFYQPLDTMQSSWSFVSKAYTDMFRGSIINPDTLNRWYWGMATWQQVLRPISETLTNATPLILTGLAVAIPFRAGLFNIGGQGQAIIGALGAGTVGILLDLPAIINLPLALLVGLITGGLWGYLVGVLKAKTGAHEVIVTIMLNYIALLLLAWYILRPGLKDPNRADAISKPVNGSAVLPKIFDPALRVSLGIILALLATAAIAWLLKRGTFGFELRAVGHNPRAAGTAGIKVGRTVALTMGLAGALAGLGGVTIVLGTAQVITDGVVGYVGPNGILVALFGRLKPWGVAAAGLLFGALQSGGQAMQTFAGVSNELVTVIQAMIVMFVTAPVLVKAIFRLRRSLSDTAKALPAMA